MLKIAKQRGLNPSYILMDSWYASLENLKFIANQGWLFLTRLKSNRLVNPDGAGNRPIKEVHIPQGGIIVLKGGLVL
jgi:putative transposase